MEQRQLGRDLTVSAVGLGCFGMTRSHSDTDDVESVATIHRALDLGITLFDTADVYGDGTNEVLVGKAIKHRRDEVVLATKFGYVREGESGMPTGVNGTPEYVKRACDASLARLGTDYIDLYYQHRVDLHVAIADTWGAMHELVEAGKVRYLGISEAAPATVRRAHAIHPISACQNEYSLFTREPEDELIGTLRELGIGLVPYSPLGRGLLSGAIIGPDQFADDNRGTLPRFQGDNLTYNLEIVEKLKQFAAAKASTPSQVALAWVLAKGKDIVPIPGTKHSKYLEENLRAIEIELSSSELALIESLVPKGVAAGNRYPPLQMAQVNL